MPFPAPPARAAKNRTPLFAGIAAVLLLAAAGASWLMRPPPPPPPPRAGMPPPREAMLPPAMQRPPPPAMDPARLEDDLWDSVKDSGDAAALNSYLAKYPSGLFAAAAKAKLASLNKPAAAPAAAPVKAAAKAAAPRVATVLPMSMPKSAAAMPGTLNANVQTAVDMARSAETRAREMAQNAEQSLHLVQAGTPGYGSEAVHAAGRWGGRLAILRTGGPAVITYGNGDRYAGGTRDGQRYGVGVFTGAPSKVFRERVGEFVADQMIGYGVVYRNDGRVRIGQWKGGVMDGYGAVYDAQGRLVEQGLYVSDKLAAPLAGN